MSARARVTAAVAAAAVAAATIVVGATLLQTANDSAATATRPARPGGAPPVALELDLDPRAAPRLRRALAFYNEGRRAEARRLFRAVRTLDGRVGAAMAAWPNGALRELRRLASARPRRAVVRLNLGLAFFWSGRRDEAVAAWRDALRVEPDSPSAIRADDLLHRNTPAWIPIFIPSFEPRSFPRAATPVEQLAAFRRAARAGSYRDRILYGVALQRIGRPRSAERELAAAARAAPNDAEAQTAAAVARFTKSRPERAFGRLGPLTRRFPRAPTVRFHLGLLLLWTGQVAPAEVQLERARSLAPRSPLGRQAARFLAGVRAAKKR